MNNNTKKTIVDAALHEFANKTYGATSLNDILAKANISKGSFYYFFKSKKDLYAYVLLESLNAKNAFMEQKTSEKPTTSLAKYMHFRLEAGLEFSNMHPDYQGLAITYSADTTSPISREWLASNVATTDSKELINVIENSRKQGEINKIYSDVFVMGVFGALFSQFGLLYPEIDLTDKRAVRIAVSQCVDFIVKGLK